MYTERTNQPTTQGRKGQANTAMEKTHQVITQGRKDQAQPDGLRGWDRVLRKVPARLEHHQDQEGIKYRLLLDGIRQAETGRAISPGLVAETGLVFAHFALSHFLRRILCWLAFRRVRFLRTLSGQTIAIGRAAGK
jgi:hypothetical protein